MQTTTTPVRHRPVQIAPDTFVIQATQGEGEGPLAVHLNAMVIRGSQPVVVDTGAPVHREQYLEDLFALVEPADVRWVFISHDDPDHYGNAEAVMDACPNATLVANWFFCERLAAAGFGVPPTRWRWVGDGESFDAGDRTLVAVRPPAFDSPTTRGLFDPTTGVYWASDAYASPVPQATAFVDELDDEFWRDSFPTFQAWLAPWTSMVDRDAWLHACARVEKLRPRVIAGTHSPTIAGAQVADALAMMRAVPAAPATPQPDQAVLDHILGAWRS